jgi:hypothetical protein
MLDVKNLLFLKSSSRPWLRREPCAINPFNPMEERKKYFREQNAQVEWDSAFCLHCCGECKSIVNWLLCWVIIFQENVFTSSYTTMNHVTMLKIVPEATIDFFLFQMLCRTIKRLTGTMFNPIYFLHVYFTWSVKGIFIQVGGLKNKECMDTTIIGCLLYVCFTMVFKNYSIMLKKSLP